MNELQIYSININNECVFKEMIKIDNLLAATLDTQLSVDELAKTHSYLILLMSTILYLTG